MGPPGASNELTALNFGLGIYKNRNISMKDRLFTFDPLNSKSFISKKHGVGEKPLRVPGDIGDIGVFG